MFSYVFLYREYLGLIQKTMVRRGHPDLPAGTKGLSWFHKS